MDGGAGVPIRKFEPGASGTGLDGMLREMGYGVHLHGYVYRVSKLGSAGRPKNMLKKDVMKLLDDERVKRGLEPIIKR